MYSMQYFALGGKFSLSRVLYVYILFSELAF